MTESLAEWMSTRITPEQRERAEAAIGKLTAGEQHRILVEMYAVATEYGDDPDRMVQLGRDITGTVHMRTRIPGYREMVAESGRRAAERLGA